MSTAEALSVAEFRAAQAARPLRPLERLMPEDRTRPGEAEEIMSSGWKLGSLPVVWLEPPIAWEEACAANRSWAFRLHSWDPLAPLLAVHDGGGSVSEIRFALAVGLDWIARYPVAEHDPASFAWYDMAVGLRAYRLAYLLDVATRARWCSQRVVGTLRTSAEQHLIALADEEQFQRHNNHGLYQAAGQLAIATRLPDVRGAAGAHDQAIERLRALVAEQFSREGVHLEHSPGYHQLVLTSLVSVLEAGLVPAGEFDTVRRRAEEALAWLALPNGRLVQFGDTDDLLASPCPPERLRSAHLRRLVTGGAVGKLSVETVRAFPESGYIIFRSGGSYLAQTCAFHSQSHKHADDLAFVWFDRGRELLVDSGLYGYLGRTDPGSELAEQGFPYSDPRRVYVESTRAHNTVEIDARSHARRKVEPYGSALEAWGERDGVLFAGSAVRHGDVEHRRVLVLSPSAWLVVIDALHATEGDHDVVQRFHFGPEVEPHTLADGVAMTVPGEPERLYLLPLLPAEHLGPVRGQEEPALLGWVSRARHRIEPAWTDAFAARSVRRHVFATLLAFGDRLPVRGGCDVSPVDGARLQARWTIGQTEHELVVGGTGEDLDIRYAAGRGRVNGA